MEIEPCKHTNDWYEENIGFHYCSKCGMSLSDKVRELESAIREHAAVRGDDRCFLDDLKLYRLVGINEHPGLNLPKEEFLSGCSRYWESQQTGGKYPVNKAEKALEWLTKNYELIKDRLEWHGMDLHDEGKLEEEQAVYKSLDILEEILK